MSDFEGEEAYTPQPTGAMRTSLNGGRYLLFGMLGVGGMASVYRCWDTELLVWRAAKVLLAELRTRNVVRERFKSEARAMAAIDHPNVAKVFDVGEDHGVPFIVLEMLDGGSLEHWLAEHGPMEPDLAIHTLIEVCEGVRAAHRAGLIHRDLKPDNVMVDRNGRCKVTDFGIAGGVASSHTKTGVAMGTLDYMAPEQRQDAKNVTVAADIYALGCMLYALVMEKTPANLFVAANEPSRLDGVPEPLKPFLIRATAYRPEDRFADADELEDALRALAVTFGGARIDPRRLVSDTGPAPDPTTHSSLVPNLSDPGSLRANSATTIADVELPPFEPPPEPAATVLPTDDASTPAAPNAPVSTGWLMLAAVAMFVLGMGTLGLGLTAVWATRTPVAVQQPAPVAPEPIAPEPIAPEPIVPVEPVLSEPVAVEPVASEPVVEPEPVAAAPKPTPKARPTPTPKPAPAPVAADAPRVPSAMVVVRDGTGLVVTCGDTTARGTASARLRNFPAGTCQVEVQWLGTPYQTSVQIDTKREVHCDVSNGKLGCR